MNGRITLEVALDERRMSWSGFAHLRPICRISHLFAACILNVARQVYRLQDLITPIFTYHLCLRGCMLKKTLFLPQDVRRQLFNLRSFGIFLHYVVVNRTPKTLVPNACRQEQLLEGFQW